MTTICLKVEVDPIPKTLYMSNIPHTKDSVQHSVPVVNPRLLQIYWGQLRGDIYIQKNCIKGAAEEALGIFHQKIKPYWWNKEAEDKIKEKTITLVALLNKGDHSKEVCEVLNGQVKQEVINKKNTTAWTKWCEYVE